MEKILKNLSSDNAALIIMDYFKGQTTQSVLTLLDCHNILVSFLPPNTTHLLQPLDISANKPAKEYLRRLFEDWYSAEVMKQLNGEDLDHLEDAILQPIILAMPIMKEVGA